MLPLRRRSSGPRSTLSISPSAPKWWPLPGTRCRCNIPPASSASTSTRARRPGFSMSRIWASCGSPAATRRKALEALVPGDLLTLAPLRMRYTLLLNEEGGILDDLMATRVGDGLSLVVNAARKEADLAHLRARLGSADDGRDAGGSSTSGASGTGCRRCPVSLLQRHLGARLHDGDGDDACRLRMPGQPVGLYR